MRTYKWTKAYIKKKQKNHQQIEAMPKIQMMQISGLPDRMFGKYRVAGIRMGPDKLLNRIKFIV